MKGALRRLGILASSIRFAMHFSNLNWYEVRVMQTGAETINLKRIHFPVNWVLHNAMSADCASDALREVVHMVSQVSL